MEGEEKSKKVAKEKRSVKKIQDCGTARKGNPRSASSGNTVGAQEYRRLEPRNAQLAPAKQRNRATSRFSSVPTLLASDAKAWESRAMKPLTGYRPSLS